jgi:deazaflavin-dependent oxidoreductase (nitroreductase family)
VTCAPFGAKMRHVNPLFKLFVKTQVWLYQSSEGRRGGTMRGRKLLLLTTVGKKTGKQRTVPVVPFFDGGETYVIASMGGAPQHPAWFLNLQANPDVGVQLGAEKWRARAVPVEGETRDRLWRSIVAEMPNFGEYEKKTSRIIPVVRLEKGPQPQPR